MSIFNVMKFRGICRMVYLACLSVASFSLIACSGDDANEIGTGIEDLDVVIEKLSDYIATTDPSIEDMKKYVSQLDGVKSLKVEKNVLSIKFKDGNTVNYDYDGLLLPPDNDYELDTLALQAMMDSISAVYPEMNFEADTVDVPTSASSYNSKAVTRATTSKKVALRRHNILIWNPWQETGDIATKSGYNTIIDMITRINTKTSSKIKFYDRKLQATSSIKALQIFGSYDIVFVLCHGNEDGKLVLPLSKIDELNKLFPGMKNYIQEINLTRRKNGERPYRSLNLHQRNLDALLPDLSHTVVFTLMCDAAHDESVMWKSCKAKNVADYFGATGRCNMKAMGPEYARVLYNMAFLHSTKDAWGEHISRYAWNERLNATTIRVNEYDVLRKGGERTVGFVLGKIPSVRKVNRQTTRSTATETSDYQINVNIYGPAGMLEDFSENMFGVKVKNMTSQQETLIPLSSSEIDYYSFIDWGDVTVADVMLKPRTLEDDCRYACSLYIVDENNVPQTFGNVFVIGTKVADNGLCPDNNHPHAIDLGLPSGTKWACCNVGASKPEDFGDYFAWGETVGYKGGKKNFSFDNYKWYKSTEEKDSDGNCINKEGFTKYTGVYAIDGYNDFCDKKTQLEPEDDAAHVNWGGAWRMPTNTEQDELTSNCTWTWTTQNGVYGRKFIGPNGNSIFLPAAGYRYDDNLDYAGVWGEYWSSSLYQQYYESWSDFAYVLHIDSYNVNWGSTKRRCGQSVRAVCP